MKNFKRIIALALVTLICICMLSSCGEEVKYEAHTRFLYSVDGGNTFKETLQEVPLGAPNPPGGFRYAFRRVQPSNHGGTEFVVDRKSVG